MGFVVDQRYDGARTYVVRQDRGGTPRRRADGTEISIAGRLHAAWDINGPLHSTIHAPLPGRVIISRMIAGFGNAVLMLIPSPPRTRAADGPQPWFEQEDADDASDPASRERGRPLTAAFCHLHERRVEVGQQVQAGDVLGTLGATFWDLRGEVGGVTGFQTHVHFSVHLLQRDAARARYVEGGDQFTAPGDDGYDQGVPPDLGTVEALDVASPSPAAGFSSHYEETWQRQVHPRIWLRQVHVDPARENLGERPRPESREVRRTLATQLREAAGGRVVENVRVIREERARARAAREARAARAATSE